MRCVHVAMRSYVFRLRYCTFFLVRPTGRLPHMQRIAMDVIGEGSLNRHSERPSLEHVYSTLHDFVFKQPQMYNMDMVAERTRILTDVAEALSRCSCTRSPSCPSYRTLSELPIWAAAMWKSFTRRLLGVKPHTRRSNMRRRGKGKLFIC